MMSTRFCRAGCQFNPAAILSILAMSVAGSPARRGPNPHRNRLACNTSRRVRDLPNCIATATPGLSIPLDVFPAAMDSRARACVRKILKHGCSHVRTSRRVWDNRLEDHDFGANRNMAGHWLPVLKCFACCEVRPFQFFNLFFQFHHLQFAANNHIVKLFQVMVFFL